MARVAGGLESDEIRREEALKEGLAHGETAENLGGREGDVQEKSDGNVRGQFGRGTEEGGEEHKVVVVDPYCVKKI